MERAVGKVRKERADLLTERRRQDIADQDKECAASESGERGREGGPCHQIVVISCSCLQLSW